MKISDFMTTDDLMYMTNIEPNEDNMDEVVEYFRSLVAGG